MANKKYYYYVLVFTDEGPVYVTDVDNADRTAQWNKEEKPRKFSDTWATELAFGLTVNGHSAVAIKSTYEITSQPYRYTDWCIKWEEVKKEVK